MGLDQKMTSRRKAATIFLCSSPLQLIHAHLIRHNYLAGQDSDCFLFYEGPVSKQLLVTKMWSSVTELITSKRAHGNAQRNIASNLKAIFAEVHWDRYSSIELIISDLYWLMNNVAVAAISRMCRVSKKQFSFSILDEGAVLYTGDRLGWKRSMRCLGRSAYLFLNGLDTVVVRNSNADYRHPACRTVYCLHPALLRVPSHVPKIPIDPGRLDEVYRHGFGELRVEPRSALYLSQPVYQTLGIARQAELVRASRDVLRRQGIVNFYYKPHHFDSEEWRNTVQTEIGFSPIPNGHGLPVEVWAKSCNADVIFGHFSSALLNMRAYGYQGRVVGCGLKQVSGVFLENKQFLEYLDVLARLGTVEMLDPFEPRMDGILAPGAVLDR
jgi:hypothetical protein